MFKKNKLSPMVWSWLALARILIGIIFLWAFLDKLFGLGFATKPEQAWVNSGSPTTGFLSHVQGPFADFFQAMAGSAGADVLFMLGLLGIGVALTLGIAVRIGAISGAVMLLLMWLASFPLENNPLIDEHLVYIAVLMAVAFALPHQQLGLQKQWQSLPTVKSHPWLW
ncbi:MAG: DoxX family protein [Candidatus Saccharibacteria bacterium]|nr:DoxX family protein [Candidatus Saccharibacteria bacterium]